MIKPINFLLIIVAAALTAFILLTSDAFGQSLNGDLVRLRPSTVPATCNTGDLRTDANDGYALKQCVANSWNDIGANPFSPFTATRLLVGDGTNIPATYASLTFNSGTGALSATSFVGNLTGDVTGNVSGSSGSTTGNAATATALAANPSNCAADTYSVGINASGVPDCSTVSNAGLAGSIAASKLVGSDIATVGTITSGTWNGSVIDIARGGTNNGSLAVTAGGALYTDGSKLVNTGAGTAGQILTSNGASAPAWAAAPAGGTNDQKEYISNGKFETDTTGWSMYADAAASTPVDCTGGSPASTGTRTTTAGEVIRDTASYEIAKSAANRQGEGASYDFVLDYNDYNNLRGVPISFEYNSTTNFASGDILVYVYDKDAGGTPQAVRTIQSSTAGNVYASTGGTRWNGVFYPTTSTSNDYRICFHIATTNATAYDFHLDSVHVGNQNSTPGYLGGPWQSCTVAGSWSANTTYTCLRRRSGEDTEYKINVATSGAPTSASLTIDTPSGDVMDTSKMVNTTVNYKVIEGSTCSAIDAGNNGYTCTVSYSDSNTVSIMRALAIENGSAAPLVTGNPVNQASPFTFGASDAVEVYFKVPIVGQAASAALSTSEILLKNQQVIISGDAPSATSGNIIIFPTKTYDPFSSYNATTGRFTAVTSGTLKVSGLAQLNGGGVSALFFYVNGSIGPAITGFNAASDVSNINGGVRVVAGDVVDIRPNATVDLTSVSYFIFDFVPDLTVFAQYNSDRWYVNANISGANPSLGVAAVTSYTEIIDAGLTMTPVSGSAPVAVMCSTTNAATAPTTSTSVCAAGSESVGANFYIPEPGIYEVCVQGSWIGSGDTAEAVNAAFEIIETPLTAQTLSLEGNVRTQVGLSAMTIAAGVDQATIQIVNNCALFNWNNVAAGTNKGVRLMYEQSVTGTPDTSALLMDANTSNGQRDFNIRVRKF